VFVAAPMLSMIIATFNSAKTISRCLDNIGTQKFTDFEIVTQDGLSKDRIVIRPALVGYPSNCPFFVQFFCSGTR
jgi:GT2 family glycosyltransferase